MKSYKTMLLELKTKQPKGDVVLKKKINGIPVLIVKDTGSLPFVVYIDGDKLDTFKSQKDAEKSATKVIKELT
tara:strand:- start:961 stop:1179 length:219 start_codon:yes stop_codon:yes gene_type:complete